MPLLPPSSHPEPRLEALRRCLLDVQSRIRSAEQRSGRLGGSCTLLAVVKRRAEPDVRALRQLGLREFAENRVQSLRERDPELYAGTRLHLIGPLQTNKARLAVRGFQVVHSVDRRRLAEILNQETDREGTGPLEVYLQVNISGEQQKHGSPPQELASLAEFVSSCPHLRPVGLMAMAPKVEGAERTRPYFASVRQLSERLRAEGAMPGDATGLSMGMSDDFEVAIEEGSDLVRVGSALFPAADQAASGSRPPAE